MSDETTQTASTPDTSAEDSRRQDAYRNLKYSEEQMQSVVSKVRQEERERAQRRAEEQQSIQKSTSSKADRDDLDQKSAIKAALTEFQSEKDAKEREREDTREQEKFERAAMLFHEKLEEACENPEFKELVKPDSEDSVARCPAIALFALEKPNDQKYFEQVISICAADPGLSAQIELLAQTDVPRARKKLKQALAQNKDTEHTENVTSGASSRTPSPLTQYKPSTQSKGSSVPSVREMAQKYANRR